MYIVYETQNCEANLNMQDHIFKNYLVSVFSFRIPLDSYTSNFNYHSIKCIWLQYTRFLKVARRKLMKQSHKQLKHRERNKWSSQRSTMFVKM